MQAAAGQYDISLLLYGRALQLQPNDVSILNAAKRIAQLSSSDALCRHLNDGFLFVSELNVFPSEC